MYTSLTSGAVFSTVGNNATFSAVLNPLPHNSTIVSVQNPCNETVFEARGTKSRYTIAGQRMIYTGALIASRYLQLNFTFKTGIPSKPNIEVILQPIVNMNMVLNCKVESTTVPKNSNLSLIFNWKVNGVNISANSRIFINGSTLSITNMQRNDEGMNITCNASEQRGLTSKTSDVDTQHHSITDIQRKAIRDNIIVAGLKEQDDVNFKETLDNIFKQNLEIVNKIKTVKTEKKVVRSPETFNLKGIRSIVKGLDKSTISNKSYAVSEGNTLSANEDIISARATSVLSVNEAKEALCQMMKLPSVARSMHNITVFRLVDDKGVLQEGVDDDDRRVYLCEKSYTFIKSGSFKYLLWPTPYQYRLDCVFKR
ncbi:hypothetical protein KUTeg_000974 [Tegillarca granosa]|uniref:Ig-like domain-containing protein n=1 Tax=Tegillarca granosa TaxID=220873 RepID=A0ABQ9FW59_TEGGR|nr:hypothetical protein KUTeg_000974 [Tegillarca granosa]